MVRTKQDRNQEIKESIEKGMAIKEAAILFNISRQAISFILHRPVNVGYKKFKSAVKPKTYLDYLKESDYSDRTKGFYIKNYAIAEQTD